MKKSEALKILGLAAGVTDDDIKRAHRAQVIAHHPDRFAHDEKARADAEERMKLINEARDVLLGRTWEPEFDSRRSRNPSTHPYADPYGWPQAGSQRNRPRPVDPAAEWPFGQGQPTWVWTSWDDTRHSGSPGFTGDPFDPFAPFRTAGVPRKTSQEVLADALCALRSDTLVVAAKIAVLLVLVAVGSLAAGLFVYTVVSFVYGLWKRFGTCLIGFFLPIAVVLTPFVFLIAPRQGAVTIGLAFAFFVAVIFDVVNLRNRIRTYRAAKRAAT